MRARESWRELKPKKRDRIVGLDGEGVGRTPHRYVLLCAADDRGQTWQVEDTKGLSTADCLDLILDLPGRALVVGFALTYDWTKILKDLPPSDIYALFHPEKERAFVVRGRVQYRPVKWNGYSLNWINRRMSVSGHGRRVTVWDVFAFFQSKFVAALADWGVGSVAELAEMARMKDQRAVLDALPFSEVRAYCLSECEKLAYLTRALIDAHDDAGLPLKSFYGAGSTATALFTKLGIKSYVETQRVPEEMRRAVACAFSGGRFENSAVGPVEGLVWNYDISSAYPYQLMFLPCLSCGKWERVAGRGVTKKIARARLALVHWHLPETSKSRREPAWGPFPVRAKDGTIIFPSSALGGWCWREEYLAAAAAFDNVEASEAWLYSTECKHWPFREVSDVYVERCRIGKEGRGKVLKLGPNAAYGKLAQSIGVNPPFQSWVWAGNITSGCRAQLIDAIASAKDRWNVLMLATDGVWTREPLVLPKPRDTGTDSTGKPLGGWEEKRFDRGVFCVRPGIYFPINPTEEQLKEVRARGLGKKTLYQEWPKIVEAWERDGPDAKVELDDIIRFVGAKSGVRQVRSSGEAKRSPDYGEWIPFPMKVSFNPLPKRRRVLGQRLECWQDVGWESHPYDAAVESPEAKALKLFTEMVLEQPDGDLLDAVFE
jgi:hypothetical protein